MIYSRAPKTKNPIKFFFIYQFPNLIRQYFLCHLAAMVILLLGGLAGYWATLENPNNYFAFMDPQLAQGRSPFSSKEQLASFLYGGREEDIGNKTLFFGHLFTNNTKVGFLTFSLGIGLGLPTLCILAQNGGIIGALAGAYHIHGLSFPLWAWILPHGITEFLAIILCSGAGFILAASIIKPNQYSRLANLKISAQHAGLIVVGTIPMFLFAGIIESFLRQSNLSDTLRYLFAVMTLLFWLFYLGFCGQNPKEKQIF